MLRHGRSSFRQNQFPLPQRGKVLLGVAGVHLRQGGRLPLRIAVLVNDLRADAFAEVRSYQAAKGHPVLLREGFVKAQFACPAQ